MLASVFSLFINGLRDYEKTNARILRGSVRFSSSLKGVAFLATITFKGGYHTKKRKTEKPIASTLPDHNPSSLKVVDGIKARAKELITYINTNAPANREAAIAITNIEQGAMWAVKSNFTG